MIKNFLTPLLFTFCVGFEIHAMEEDNGSATSGARPGYYTPYQAVVKEGRGQTIEMMMCPRCQECYPTKALLGDIVVDIRRAHQEECGASLNHQFKAPKLKSKESDHPKMWTENSNISFSDYLSRAEMSSYLDDANSILDFKSSIKWNTEKFPLFNRDPLEKGE